MLWLAALLGRLDSVLSWLERTDWGRQVIALVVVVLWAVYGLIASIPGPWLIWGAVMLFGMVLRIEERLSPYLRLWIAPPILVEISGFGFDQESYQASEREIERIEFEHRSMRGLQPVAYIKGPIFVLNTSKKREVSLKFAWFTVKPDHANYLGINVHGDGIEFDGLKMNLDAGEQTEGEFRVSVGSKLMLQIPNSKHFVIVDRFTGRVARVPVPGQYPPKSFRRAR